MTPSLSVIIPAYNEAARLPPYLRTIHDYLSRRYGGRHEVFVVDDGSTDATAAVVLEFARTWPQLRLVGYAPNRGKGVALGTGMLAACGDLLLLADADGATGIEYELPLRQAIELGADAAIGSRLARRAGLCRSRAWHRNLASRVFAWVVRRALRLPVQDTQCGFKMFRRGVGQKLVRGCRQQGFLFDVEILALAHWCHYRIAEVPVAWSEVPGSKVRLARDGWRMLCGIWGIRHRHTLFRASSDEVADPRVPLPGPHAELTPMTDSHAPARRSYLRGVDVLRS
jgi:dolichyl-phosphate beta-glucosyltransferase